MSARALAAPFVLLLIATAAHALTADRYELALRPDDAARVLEGPARIRLTSDGETAPAPAPAIELASPNLLSVRATVDGRAVAFEKATTAPLWLEVDYRAPAADALVFGPQ